ncbi:hypothetical protein [Amycolatopsis magusensis]
MLGVLALAAALAAGHLVAAFFGVNASPYLAVGNGAIDLTPVELKNFAIRTFGTYDKLVLLLSMAVVMIIMAALAGIASRRTPVPGTAAIILFGLVGLLAVFQRPDLSSAALLAPATSLLVGTVVFRWLRRLARAASAPSTEPTAGRDPSRRSFLVAGAGVIAGAGVAGTGGQLPRARSDQQWLDSTR